MDWNRPRVRLLVVAGLALVWMSATIFRLAYLQLFSYSDYLNRAEKQQQRVVEITPRRGVIYDRNMHELAMSISVDSCFAVPSEVSDHEMAARLLAPVLDMTADEIESKLASSQNFAWIARKISAEQTQRIQGMNLRGIYFVKERKRFYPKRDLAAADLGWVDIDEKGAGGLEYEFDKDVRGRPGRMMVLTDAHKRWFEGNEQGAEAGSNIVLTIDQNIQYIIETALAEAIEQTRAKAGTIIVEDPSTGELLGVANQPTFNPNAPGDVPADNRMNRAVGALYEPGSVFKIVTLSGAINEGLARADELVDCQMGSIYVAGHKIRDHKPFGLLTVAQILSKSSDVGAIKLGLRLGPSKFYQYIRGFGFGQSTGVDLPGENKGMLRRPEMWGSFSIGSISMGQEVGVTAIQLISAMNTIANGGKWVRPHIVRGMKRNGVLTPEPQPEPRRVISGDSAATMRTMLEGVLLPGGTAARLGALSGYTAGGKTGTAQRYYPATGRYSASAYVASFVGFAPLNEPAITVLVTLDSPVGLHQGGEVSAPVFKRVSEQILAYLNVPQDEPLSPRLQRAAYSAKPDASDSDSSDFDPSQTEDAASDSPIAESPPPAPADAPAPTVAISEGDAVIVPALQGKTVRGAAAELAKLGLTPALIGTGVAVEESPEAGATVRRGSRVTVQFGEPRDGPMPPSRKPKGSAKSSSAGARAHTKLAGKAIARFQGQR